MTYKQEYQVLKDKESQYTELIKEANRLERRAESIKKIARKIRLELDSEHKRVIKKIA